MCPPPQTARPSYLWFLESEPHWEVGGSAERGAWEVTELFRRVREQAKPGPSGPAHLPPLPAPSGGSGWLAVPLPRGGGPLPHPRVSCRILPQAPLATHPVLWGQQGKGREVVSGVQLVGSVISVWVSTCITCIFSHAYRGPLRPFPVCRGPPAATVLGWRESAGSS